MKKPMLKISRIVPVLLLLLLILSGCDKENPINVLPSDVAGDYQFTEYQFVPDASAIAPANVLDTLITDKTYIRLIAGGQFIFNYQFRGGQESIIAGEFTVTTSNIILRASPGSEARLISLLLSSPIEFDRSSDSSNPGQITSTTLKTVDLESYSDNYSGVPPVRGRLIMRLSPVL